jgi:dGTP triphosphohydrolase
MSSPANVNSIAALAEFRAELAEFVEDARDALSANEMEIQRAFAWLDDQTRHWQREIRNRQDEVVNAKNNLASRKMFKTFGKPPDCTEQEKLLRRAQQRLVEAEEKFAACKRWAPQLRRNVDEYESQARLLAGMLEADMLKAGIRLEKQIAALEAYVNTAPPPAPPADAAEKTAGQ